MVTALMGVFSQLLIVMDYVQIVIKEGIILLKQEEMENAVNVV
jgi:hypothetical protein